MAEKEFKIGKLEANVENLKESVDSVKDDVATVKEDVGKVKERVSNVELKIAVGGALVGIIVKYLPDLAGETGKTIATAFLAFMQ